MPDDSAVLPTAGRTRRAGDTVPTLRRAVEALIDGDAIAWDRAERQGRTPLERRMTRHLRELTALAGLDARPDPSIRPTPLGRIVRGLTIVAAVQACAGLAAAAWLTAWTGALVPETLVLVGMSLLAGVAWRTHDEAVPGAFDLLILLAAWAARPPVTALAALSPLWAVLTLPSRVVLVEATIPLALIGAALARASLLRFTWRDRLGRALTLLALGSSLVLMPGVALRWMPAALMASAALWAVVSLAALLWWRGAPVGHEVGRPATTLSSTLQRLVVDALAAWRGTHTTRLAALTSGVHRARTPREVVAELRRHVLEVTGASQAFVLVRGDVVWDAIGGDGPALPADSALAAVLEGTEGAVRVHPGAPAFAWLPDADRRWVRECDIAVVARLAAPEGHTIGGLLLGTSGDRRAATRRDLAFLAASASIAGVALAGLPGSSSARRQSTTDVREEVPYECEACGRLSPEATPCACGGATGLAALPAVLHGTFVLERRIGRGGMGVVYRAHDSQLERLVALKTLPTLAPTTARALQAEARAMAALEHASVASLHGLVTWRNTPVLVVEYLAGGTLASRIASGPMRAGDALVLARTLTDALAALHARGWVHGDIKPSNIGLTRDGVPKLLDFGLTRWHEATTTTGGVSTRGSSDGTRQGPLAGTPLYLSPEALSGRPAGEPDDVWALSLVIVELLTGVHPFRASSMDGVAARVQAGEPIDVRRWAPATPAWLADALTRALLPVRMHRLASARALADALAQGDTVAVRTPADAASGARP